MPPELSSALGGGSRCPGTEFRLGRRKQIPLELSSTLSFVWRVKPSEEGKPPRSGFPGYIIATHFSFYNVFVG